MINISDGEGGVCMSRPKAPAGSIWFLKFNNLEKVEKTAYKMYEKNSNII